MVGLEKEMVCRALLKSPVIGRLEHEMVRSWKVRVLLCNPTLSGLQHDKAGRQSGSLRQVPLLVDGPGH
jgi:hypothetical protein